MISPLNHVPKFGSVSQADFSTLESQVVGNSSGVAANSTAISGNTTALAGQASAIAANSTAIASLNTALGTKASQNSLNTLATDVLGLPTTSGVDVQIDNKNVQQDVQTLIAINALLAGLPAGGWTNAEIQILLDQKGSATTLATVEQDVADIVSGTQALAAVNVTGSAIVAGSLQAAAITSSASFFGATWLAVGTIPFQPSNGGIYGQDVDATGHVSGASVSATGTVTCGNISVNGSVISYASPELDLNGVILGQGSGTYAGGYVYMKAWYNGPYDEWKINAEGGGLHIQGRNTGFQSTFYNGVTFQPDRSAGKTNLIVTGNLWYGGSLTNSDRRLKDQIEELSESECVELLKKVSAKTYERTDLKQVRYGFIAQDLRDVDTPIPRTCVGSYERVEDGETYWGIDYARLTPILWQVCRSQQSKLEALEARVSAMEKPVKRNAARASTH